VKELLTQVASRVAALKTLEGALLSLMLSQRIAARSFNNASALLAAPELAKLFGVPESWVREQARLGNLPSIKLGHYVRFRIEEVERFLANAPAKPLDCRASCLYATYSMTGVEIRALREKLGWTQMALAEAVGVTSNTVARWERGEMAISEPAARLLQKIAAEQRSRTGKRRGRCGFYKAVPSERM
jgi:excisionase family DNA binding protein